MPDVPEADGVLPAWKARAGAATARAASVWRPIFSSAILRGHERGTCFSGSQSPGSDGLVAQLVEQRTENPCVGGSIPPLATNEFNGSGDTAPSKLPSRNDFVSSPARRAATARLLASLLVGRRLEIRSHSERRIDVAENRLAWELCIGNVDGFVAKISQRVENRQLLPAQDL